MSTPSPNDIGTPPPLQSLPTARERKYDRQLRLWAASGQAALENAHILCLNSGTGVTAIEALKNLVLPGIGQFTIHDSVIVTAADLGVNFFLDKACLGSYRAEGCCRLLKELNPDVQGHAVTEPLASWLTQPGVLKPYTLIIVTGPIETELLSIISSHARQHNTPLIYGQSVGFRSVFSLALPPAFPIVDTHPDPETVIDLRLADPWTELAELAKVKTDRLDTLSEHDLGHVPYALLLLHFLEQWRAKHDGRIPSNSRQKNEFRELVRKAGPPHEENFEEACNAVLRAVKPSTPPTATMDVLGCTEALNLHACSASFWYIAQAVHKFVKTHCLLPLPGAVPDMKATSADFITLQTVYKTKARQDCAEVTETVRALEQQYGRPADMAIPQSEIEAFCKSAAYIKLLRGRFGHVDRVQSPMTWDAESAKQALESTMLGSDPLAIYISFLAYDNFVNTHKIDNFGTHARAPGLYDDDVEADARKLTDSGHAIFDAMIKAADGFVEDPMYSDVKTTIGTTCQELARSGGAELHNTAALTGGMIAQEAIKIVTAQYVPLDNVCVYDGIHSKVDVIRL